MFNAIRRLLAPSVVVVPVGTVVRVYDAHGNNCQVLTITQAAKFDANDILATAHVFGEKHYLIHTGEKMSARWNVTEMAIPVRAVMIGR